VFDEAVKRVDIIKPAIVENSVPAAVVAAAASSATRTKSSSLVCEDLIPTCQFLKVKCNEIQKFVPHPCMRTCNLCP
jgi:hypothetical protein